MVIGQHELFQNSRMLPSKLDIHLLSFELIMAAAIHVCKGGYREKMHDHPLSHLE